MNKVTSQWLEETNAELKKQGIIDGDQKMKLAEKKWRQENVSELLKLSHEESSSLIDNEVSQIRAYFLTQTKKDQGYINPQFEGVFYFFGGFWKIVIPFRFGRFKISIFDHLEMPSNLKSQLVSNENSLEEFLSIYADSIDYGYGIEAVDSICKTDFSKELFKSADKHLKATISLLRHDKASSKAIEDARMSIEIFLKAFLSFKENLTDKDLRNKYSHDIKTATNDCIKHGVTDLISIEPKLNLFPDVKARYESHELTFGELWTSYRIALQTATAILRNLTGLDSRKSIQTKKLPKGNFLSIGEFSNIFANRIGLKGIHFSDQYKDFLVDVSPLKLEEIIFNAVGSEIPKYEVIIVNRIGFIRDDSFGIDSSMPSLKNYLSIGFEFKTYSNFVDWLQTDTSRKTYRERDFFANELGYTEIDDLDDGLGIKIYIAQKFVPELW